MYNNPAASHPDWHKKFNIYENLSRLPPPREGEQYQNRSFLGKSPFAPNDVIAIGDEDDDEQQETSKPGRSLYSHFGQHQRDQISVSAKGVTEGSISTHDGLLTTETSLMLYAHHQLKRNEHQSRKIPGPSYMTRRDHQNTRNARDPRQFTMSKQQKSYQNTGMSKSSNTKFKGSDVEEIEVSDDEQSTAYQKPFPRRGPNVRLLSDSQPSPQIQSTILQTQPTATNNQDSDQEDRLVTMPPVASSPDSLVEGLTEPDLEKQKERTHPIKAGNTDRFLKSLDMITSKFKTTNRLSQLVSTSLLGPKVPFSQRYQTLQVLGEGGSCVVKKIMDLQDKSVYAAKTCKTQDSQTLKKEAKILKMLCHPNIVSSYGIFDSLSGVIYDHLSPI